MEEDTLVCPAKMNTEKLGYFILFQMLNSTRFGNHSANKRYEDKEGNGRQFPFLLVATEGSSLPVEYFNN